MMARGENAPAGSKLAQQYKDQQHDDDETESAAAIVAGSIERTAADAAKAAEQGDDQNDEDDGSKRHRFVSLRCHVRRQRLLCPMDAAKPALVGR
jgi:hypothetical protein